ncbi:RNA polymerase II transcription factor SIII subunit A-domain-containing protein [Mycena rebaudengoi]|nr:RNA polymerase II transcription factor SIII subunit A-domain-containing protein [Mycena rebaudengoi]
MTQPFSDDRVPTLVSCCQRVAAVHVDAISSLGDELRYDLVKPVLERCTVDQLLRLESASPYLQKETPEIWKNLCFRTYPLAAERYRLGHLEEPESWKDQYFILVEEEARRVEEIGSRIRNQRLEAEERKKEREVKITDRLPPSKRSSRGWGVPVQPKTLFQKTKSEASRLQKNMYAKPMFIPPMPSGKNYRVLPPADSILLPAAQSSRVTVSTVVHRVSASSSIAPSVSSSSKVPAIRSSQKSLPTPPPSSSHSMSRSSRVSLSSSSSKSTPSTALATSTSSPTSHVDEPPRKKARPEFSPASDSRPPKPSTPLKRDPMAALFLPKHRAYSQRVN